MKINSDQQTAIYICNYSTVCTHRLSVVLDNVCSSVIDALVMYIDCTKS